MAQFLSDNGYLAIKPEASAGVAVIPTVFVPLISESVKTVVNHSADNRIKGISWKSSEMLRGFRQHEGDIVVLGDPDTLGHFLNMAMVKGSTTGDATGYTHPFTSHNTASLPDTYTFDIKKGDKVVRYFGVRIEQLKLEFVDGALQITATISAMGQFSTTYLGVTSAGAVTSLTLDDEYDIAPNRGLVIGDVLSVGGVDVTLTSVNANGIAVGFSSITVGKSAGELVFLKPQTPANATLQDPLYLGNVIAGFGADGTASDTKATQALGTPLYDLTITYKCNLFKQNGSNRIDPVLISPRLPEAQIECKQLYASSAQFNNFLNRTKQAITFKMFGKFIKSDFTTQELFTFKFHKVKLIDNTEPLNVGEYIMDEQSYEALYDDTDTKAITCSLINRTAGTAY